MALPLHHSALADVCTRRGFLGKVGMGLGSVALMDLLHQEGVLANAVDANPRATHHPAKGASRHLVIHDGGAVAS